MFSSQSGSPTFRGPEAPTNKIQVSLSNLKLDKKFSVQRDGPGQLSALRIFSDPL